MENCCGQPWPTKMTHKIPEFLTHLLQRSFKCSSFCACCPALWLFTVWARAAFWSPGLRQAGCLCRQENQAVSVSAGRNDGTEQIPQTKSPCRAVLHPWAAGEGTGQVTCTGGFPGVWQQGCLSRLRWLKAELPRECRRKGRTSCHCLWALTMNWGWFAADVILNMSRLGYWAEGPWGLYSPPCLYPHQWCCAKPRNLMTQWSKQYQTLAFIFSAIDKLLQ